MSRLSITFGRSPASPPYPSSAGDQEVPGSTSSVRDADPAWYLPQRVIHGCVVVRRITDDRGREWRVRQLWSENCHGLLFQCAVPGIRSEIRPNRAPLESLTYDDLVDALSPADD